MAYPYNGNTFINTRENSRTTVTGSCSAGTLTFDSNSKPGARAYGVAFAVKGNDAAVTVSVEDYANSAQDVMSGSKFKFLAVGASTVTTNLTLAATSTSRGYSGVLIGPGDQYGAAAPIMEVCGAKITVATTATTGTWELTFTGAEI